MPPKKKKPAAACPSCKGALEDGYCEACDAEFDDTGSGKPAGFGARLAELEKRLGAGAEVAKDPRVDKMEAFFHRLTGKKLDDVKPEDADGLKGMAGKLFSGGGLMGLLSGGGLPGFARKPAPPAPPASGDGGKAA